VGKCVLREIIVHNYVNDVARICGEHVSDRLFLSKGAQSWKLYVLLRKLLFSVPAQVGGVQSVAYKLYFP